MAHVVLRYDDSPLALPDGRVYRAQACGRQRGDRLWEGWLEFLPDDGSVVLRSRRETTQSNLAALEYWATGLTPVYLKGALERTLTPPLTAVEPPTIPSVYDEPAPSRPTEVETPADSGRVLDPFAVYARGEDVLRQRLATLDPHDLRAIVLDYELVDPAAVDVDALTDVELIAIIVGAVRGRLAA